RRYRLDQGPWPGDGNRGAPRRNHCPRPFGASSDAPARRRKLVDPVVCPSALARIFASECRAGLARRTRVINRFCRLRGQSLSQRLSFVALLAIFAVEINACVSAPHVPLRIAATVSTATPAPMRLPADDVPHDALTEWWYYTGHLVGPTG